MPERPKVQRVPVEAMSPERFATVAGAEQWSMFEQLIEHAGAALRGRVIWNVNSTARGGGVAEMLISLVAYARGGGVDSRWLVIEGDPDFFQVTKFIQQDEHTGGKDEKVALLKVCGNAVCWQPNGNMYKSNVA